MAPRVYLAGPITGLSYGGATDWREYATQWLRRDGIDGFSPLRAKTYLKDETSIDGSPGAYQRGSKANPLSSPKGICTRDRWDVSRADAVLMNLLDAERVSIGSMIEVGWADAYRVPIVVVMEPAEVVKNIHSHAMLDQLAGYIMPDLESALRLVRALVLP